MPSVGALEGYFIVTLVRNPWDRMVSYYHWLREQGFNHRAVELAKAHNFSGFLNHPETVAANGAESYGGYVSVGGNEAPTSFVRLEALREDIQPFEKHLGFKLDIPHVNRSDRKPDWRGYYSEADIELVARMYAADIARFGYRFEG